MEPIKRYNVDRDGDRYEWPDGDYVLHADHLRAMQERIAEIETSLAVLRGYYDDAVTEGTAAAVKMRAVMREYSRIEGALLKQMGMATEIASLRETLANLQSDHATEAAAKALFLQTDLAHWEEWETLKDDLRADFIREARAAIGAAVYSANAITNNAPSDVG